MDVGAVEKLVGQESRARAIDAITRAIDESFTSCPARMTRNAVTERFDVCLKIIARLRHEHGWSLLRAFDHVGTYLRCELSGIAYSPKDTRSVWAAPTA
jgi:hypothetical protein